MKGRPKAVPSMTPCPECGVTLEAGKGKHGLVWHGCSEGPSSLDLVESGVLKQMIVASSEATIAELIALLEAVRVHRRESTGAAAVPGDVQDWMARR